MTSTIRRADEEAATPASAAMDCRSTSTVSHWPVGIDAGGTRQVSGWRVGSAERPYVVEAATDFSAASTPGVRQQPWDPLLNSLLNSPCRGSAGIVTFSSDYGPLLPHVGSSSFIVDRRPAKRLRWLPRSRLSARFREILALPVADQLQELGAALSLNKSQLARILSVTRPTLYEWYQGKEPNAANSERIRTLLRVLTHVDVSGARPLNARFVRRPMDIDGLSLLELLCGDRLDDERVVRALDRARNLGAAAAHSRTARADRLRALGFEDPGDEQRKEQLARNVALQDWPRR